MRFCLPICLIDRSDATQSNGRAVESVRGEGLILHGESFTSLVFDPTGAARVLPEGRFMLIFQ
jgi:hypothetical protein